LLKFFGFITGKKKEMNKLIGSLQIDNSYTRKTLNWTPPVSVEEGIRRMVKDK
jgi:nucleoside-diphosphate-sugar epimerase